MEKYINKNFFCVFLSTVHPDVRTNGRYNGNSFHCFVSTIKVVYSIKIQVKNGTLHINC